MHIVVQTLHLLMLRCQFYYFGSGPVVLTLHALQRPNSSIVQVVHQVMKVKFDFYNYAKAETIQLVLSCC